MGGKSSSGIVGYKYFFGIHMGIGRGPVDALHEIRVGDKQAWLGEATDNTTVNIDKPSLFGGDDREGGIKGPLELMMGGPTQVASSGLQAMLGSVLPGFRGVFTAFFNGLVSGNNPYPKAWKFRLNRTLAGWDGAVWNPEKCRVGVGEATLLEEYGNLTLRIEGEDIDPPVDTSPLSRTITTGPATIYGTSGEAGGYFDFRHGETGRTDYSYASVATSDEIASTGEDFLIRMKVYLNSYHTPLFNGPACILGQYPNPNYVTYLLVWYGSGITGHLVFLSGSDWVFTSASPLPLGRWFQLELKRVSGTLTLSIDGVLDTSVTYTGAIGRSGIAGYYAPIYFGDDPFRVAGSHEKNSSIDGMISDILFAKGDTGTLVLAFPAYAMNPAHIIYETLTNRVWGRGLAATKLDVASFTAAASTLFNEGFGLCLKWTRKDSIESFVQGVLDHIGGVLFVSRTTKLYTLKLIRSDYDLDDLTAFTTENGILEIRDATVASIGSSVNTVVVTYHDWQDDEDRTVSVKNVAAMRAAGGVVNTLSKTYIGIPTADLALRVAQRDLKAASTNLRRFTLVMDRRGESIEPGSVIAIEDASRGIPKMPVRVGRVEDGTITDGRITLTVVQDVFGLPSTSFATDVPSTWTPPNTTPCIDEQEVFEAPYFLMASRMTPADLDYVTPDAGYLVALNSQGQSLNQGFNIAVRESAPTSDDNPPDTSYFCG